MRIGVYGGSFNPPHVGHAMVAAWLRWTARVDEVWFVPSYAHPFEKRLTDHALRMRWCEALTSELGSGFRVDGIEADLPKPSFTIDTLNTLAERHPEHRFRLVVGADVLPTTAKWKDWASIAARFAPVVVGRVGYPAVEGVVAFPDVSSSEIRDRLRRGLPVDHLVPASVLALIGDTFVEAE